MSVPTTSEATVGALTTARCRHPRGGRRIHLLLLACMLALWGTGCGVFYPTADQIEYPDPPEESDPFRFAEILTRGTKERFAKLNREDVFHESFTYTGNDNQQFARQRFFSRLDELEYLYIRDDARDTTLMVSWSRNRNSTEDSTFSIDDTVTAYRDYTVTLRCPLTVNPFVKDSLVEQSTARFRLVFHSYKNTWTILSWTDTRGIPGLTFFHPEYRD